MNEILAQVAGPENDKQAEGTDLLNALRVVTTPEQKNPGWLADQTRKLFAVSPGQQEFDIWEQVRRDYEQQHGPDSVKITQDPKGFPTGFEIRTKDIQGVDRWQTVGADEVKKRVERAEKDRSRILSDIEESGKRITMGERLGLGFKLTPKGQANYLRENYGVDNVFPVIEGNKIKNFLVIDKNNQVLIADPEGPDFGDIADIVGEVVEAAPGAVTSGIGAAMAAQRGLPPSVGGIAGGVPGDVLGSAVRQAVSKALPGEDYPDLTTGKALQQRALAGAVNVGAGIVGEGAMAGLKAARGATMPWPRERRALTKQLRGGKTLEELEPAMRAGRRLEGEIGTQYTPGQLTMTQAGLGYENMMGKKGVAADIMGEHKAKQISNLGRYLDNAIKAAAKTDTTPGAVGGRIKHSYEMYLKRLSKERSATANKIFERANAVVKGKRVIPLNETMTEIDDIIKNFTADVHTSSGNKVVDSLRRLKSDLLTGRRRLEEIAERHGITVEEAKAMTGPAKDVLVSPKSLSRSLEMYGQAANGLGSVIKDLEDKSMDRRIARRIFGALRRDLDQAAEAPGTKGQAADILREARNIYRDMSEIIDISKNNVTKTLTKMEDNADLFAKKMGTAYSPQEIKNTLKIFDKADPDLSQELRGAALKELVDAVGTTKGVVSPNKLLTMIYTPKHRQRILALFADDKKGLETLRRLATTAQGAKRLAAEGSTVGKSPTQPLQWASRLATKLQIPIVSPALEGVLKVLSPLADPEKFARVITDPMKRDLLLGIVDPKGFPKIANINRMAVRLTALIARDEMEETEELEQ
jgi:hypothetical protein